MSIFSNFLHNPAHAISTFISHAFALPSQPAAAPAAPDPLVASLKASVDTQTQAISAQTAFAGDRQRERAGGAG
jgi:hypothetical protein